MMHLLMHRFLVSILERHGYQTRAYADPQEFLQEAEPSAPACLLVDLKMPGLDGIEVQKILRERAWILPLIFISSYGSVSEVAEAMKLGGVDFIEKPLSEKMLLSAVERALELSWRRNARRCTVSEARSKIQSLTERELEVLPLLVQGLLNKQIAARLEIAERTVKAHRARIMEKLGVDSVALLVPIVLTAGLAMPAGQESRRDD